MSLLKKQLRQNNQTRINNPIRQQDSETCPICEGLGEIMDVSRIHSRSIDPPMMDCPECWGKGWVPLGRAKEILKENKQFADYEQDYEDSYQEARWEFENER